MHNRARVIVQQKNPLRSRGSAHALCHGFSLVAFPRAPGRWAARRRQSFPTIIRRGEVVLPRSLVKSIHGSRSWGHQHKLTCRLTIGSPPIGSPKDPTAHSAAARTSGTWCRGHHPDTVLHVAKSPSPSLRNRPPDAIRANARVETPDRLRTLPIDRNYF